MANTSGEKELKRNYPCETGIEADSKHEGRIVHLVPEKGSLYPARLKKGM